jgi:hypothetical protein
MDQPLADPGGCGSDYEDDDGGLILAVAKTTAAEKCRQRGPRVPRTCHPCARTISSDRRSSQPACITSPSTSRHMLFALPAPASHACVSECEVIV